MNLVDLTDGKGRLSLEEVQQLRGYVRQGSPVLLAPEAAMRVFDSIERDVFHGYRERMLAEHDASAAKAVAEITRLREDNERLRAELAALQPLAEAANYVGLLWPLALEDDAVGDLIDEARKLQKRRAATQDAAETNRSL